MRGTKTDVLTDDLVFFTDLMKIKAADKIAVKHFAQKRSVSGHD
jgi:hypothetical protein